MPVAKSNATPRTPTIREWVELWAGAFAILGKQEYVAMRLGKSRQAFNKILQYDGDTHRHHLSVWDLFRLRTDREFWRYLTFALIRFYGLERRANDDSAEVLREVRELLKQGR